MEELKTESAILTLSCPDQKGIVASVTNFLARAGANIMDSCQYNDRHTRTFFMRVAFSQQDLQIPVSELERAFKGMAQEFNMVWQLNTTQASPRMALLVSKLDHCLYDLLLRQRTGELAAQIPLIISNHPDLQPVAEDFEIPFYYRPVLNNNRIRQENEIIELLEQYKIDLVVLARYMQVVSPEFVERYRGRLINIHHSFLPAFVGGRPYHQAFERGVKMIGATGHYVTEELDQGPIIAQDVVQVSHRDSVADLVRKGRDLERLVLARAVRAHLENKVLTAGRRTIVFE